MYAGGPNSVMTAADTAASLTRESPLRGSVRRREYIKRNNSAIAASRYDLLEGVTGCEWNFLNLLARFIYSIYIDWFYNVLYLSINT